MLRFARNVVLLMAATAWLMLSFSSFTNQIRTRYRNWRTTSAMHLQPSKSQCYIRYTSTWWQHDCWLTVQTLCAIYILTSERISQGHVQTEGGLLFRGPLCITKATLPLCLSVIEKKCIKKCYGFIIQKVLWTMFRTAVEKLTVDYEGVFNLLAACSEAWVCGRCLAGIVGSNPTGGMDVSRECCVFSDSLCVGLFTPKEDSYLVGV